MDELPMYLRWDRRQLKTNHQEEVLCPHDVDQPWTLAPRIVLQGKTVWRPGPAIRECCITRGKGLAIAAWWWEVERRFEELRTAGLDDAHMAAELVRQLSGIEALLEERVPKATRAERQRYIWYREDVGTEKKVRRIPARFKKLGLTWPCKREDLDKRWRELARKAHPDMGGSLEVFKELSDAYRQAKEVFEKGP